MAIKLVKNKLFWISIAFSLFLTWTGPNVDSSFSTNIPIIIGILVSAVFTTVTLIFGLIANSEVAKLDENKRQIIQASFDNLKSHLYLLIILLVISFLSSYWTTVFFPLLPHVIFIHITVQLVTIFIQLECLLLSMISMVEMIAVVFELFKLRWSLLIRTEESNKLTPLKNVSSNEGNNLK